MKQLLQTLRRHIRLLNRQRLRKRQARRGKSYALWLQAHDSLGQPERQALEHRLAALHQTPQIALLMVVSDPPAPGLHQAIMSLQTQMYPHWQLCIADDACLDPGIQAAITHAAATDSRIRVTKRLTQGEVCVALNSALDATDAAYVAVMAPNDLLREHALLLFAEALQQWPRAQLVYSDEDTLRSDGTFSNPCFKPDWNPELLLSQHYIGRLAVWPTARIRAVGGFRVGLEGAEEHDLALRATQGLHASDVVHIPHVLAHTGRQEAGGSGGNLSQALAHAATERAAGEHLQRLGLRASVSRLPWGGLGLRAASPAHQPEVTLIVPTRDGRLTLPRCFGSLTQLTTYPNWRLLVVDNGSVDAGFLRTLDQVAQHPRCRVLRDDRPFNYSAINNNAISTVSSEYVLLLNDDTEIITHDWLDQLLGWATQPDVGAVGARLWYADKTLQHGGVVLGIGDVAGHAHRHVLSGDPGYCGRAASLQNFSALTGACLLVSRANYWAVGGLDEDQLGVAYNDVDFCLKLRARGLRNIFVPMAELMHHESVSRGSDRETVKRQRMLREASVMEARWGALLERDPAYNPNLSLKDESFTLAFPPRVNLRDRWFDVPRLEASDQNAGS